jgi:steroid 5-alpha reductase family enzyme
MRIFIHISEGSGGLMLDLYASGALALGVALVALWIISMVRGHVSFIDAFWGSGFIITAFAAAFGLPEIGAAQTLMLALLSLWGLRLSAYLLWRYLSHGEDPRYVKILGERQGFARHLYSLFIVFTLQGALILVVAAPVIGLLSEAPRGIDGLTMAGMAVWALGFFFESVGDWQLMRFKADPANEGKVMDQGLWAWTRHPNYFGDFCVWWGIWLIGHDLTLVFAPLLMSFILIKWSGVPMTERGLMKRRPGYAAYVERTSSFFPRLPRS